VSAIANEMHPTDVPIDVAAIFRKNGILLIGATGFMGKATVALLLDRYPDLKKLYVLCRAKPGRSAEQRFYGETANSPAMAPSVEKLGLDFVRSKIQVLEGDVSEPLCGLSPDRVKELKGAVRVVINSSGLVDFSPPLDESLATNLYGTRNTIQLCHALGARLVHISTCYVVGAYDGRVPEDRTVPGFYPQRNGAADDRFDCIQELKYCEEAIKSARQSYQNDPMELRKELVRLGMERAQQWGWINTYTYMKSLGEQFLAREQDLLYTIVRPAIVGTAIRFPFPGWTEGFRTTAPLILMAAAGVKSWPVRKDDPLEIVPVDLVAAGMLIASAAVLSNRHHQVYQLGTADVNPVLYRRLVNFLGMYSRKINRRRSEGSKILNMARAYIETRAVTEKQLQGQRALKRKLLNLSNRAVSRLSSLSQRRRLPGKERLQDLNRRLRVLSREITLREQTLDQYIPFMVRCRFIFESRNVRDTYSQLAEADRQRLIWDPENIDWADYWVHKHTKGIEKWIRPEFVRTMKAPRAGKAKQSASASQEPVR
jgi:long-chain acyl-CoA synthetase